MKNNQYHYFFKVLMKALNLFFILLLIAFCRPVNAFESSLIQVNQAIGPVIEHLRLHVAESDREAWLQSEKATWEPWLSKQSGFINRQLLWDPQNEEATVLIRWSSRSKWKSIPQEEINIVQRDFEKAAREELGVNTQNPFPLKFEGELIPQ